MAIIDEEEKRKRAQERRAAEKQYQQKREELLAQNAAITAQKQAQKKTAGQKASYEPMTGAQVEASIPAYSKKKPGDNNMAKVAEMYGKESADVSSMSFEDAMGFATRIVYDDERDDFLKRWQANEKKRNGKAPTLDEMRAHLNRQKTGGLYADANAAYSKQVKDQFAADYKAIHENKKNQATISAQMTALSGIFDINGDAINVNTADMNTIIRAIRAEPSEKRRTAYADAVELLTKTPGSRFYGVTFDKSRAKTFLNSAALSKDEYDNWTSMYESRFDPLDPEKSAEQYRKFYEQIEAKDFTSYKRRSYIDALNDAYMLQMETDALPDLTETAADEPEEEKSTPGIEAQRGVKPKASPVVGGAVWNAQAEPYTIENGQVKEVREAAEAQAAGNEKKAKLRFETASKLFRGKAPEVIAREIYGPMPKKVPTFEEALADETFDPDWDDEEETASEEVYGPMPKEESPTKPPELIDSIVERYGAPDAKTGIGGDTRAYGDIDLTGDLGKALEYKQSGRTSELNKETQDALEALFHTPGMDAWFGVLGESEFSQFATIGEDGAIFELNNTPTEMLYMENVGRLGPSLKNIAVMLMDEEFPAELETNILMAGAQLIQEANEWATSDAFEADIKAKYGDKVTAAMVNPYEAYQDIYRNSESKTALAAAIAYAHEERDRRREAEQLSAEDAAKTEAELLKQAQEAYVTGNYTPEQAERVMSNLRMMPEAERLADPMYAKLKDEIDTEFLYGESKWIDEQVLSMAEALGGEYTASTDMDWACRVVAQEYLEKALSDKVDLAYTLGYDSMEAYAQAHGGITMESLQADAKLMMLRLADDMGEEELQIMYSGEGAKAKEIAYAAFGSGITGSLGDIPESVYTFMTNADRERDRARAKAIYDKEYGLFSEEQLIADLRAMADGGYFPNEEFAAFVKTYLDVGGNPYALGIVPDDMQFIRKSAVALKQTEKDYDNWARSTLTQDQGFWYEAGKGTTDNMTRLIISGIVSKGVGSALFSLGSVANPAILGSTDEVVSLYQKVIKPAKFVGASIGFGTSAFNQGASTIYAEDTQEMKQTGKPAKNTQRWANIMGVAQSLATTTAEYLTVGTWADNVGRYFGISSAVRSGMQTAGLAGSMNAWKATAIFLNSVGKQMADEVIVDELKEGFLSDAAESSVRALRTMTENGGGTPFDALAATAVGAWSAIKNAKTTADGVIKNAPMMALTMLPMALIGAGGELKGTLSESVSAAEKVIRTGDGAAVEEFIDTLIRETSEATPEQRAAIDEAITEAQVAEIASGLVLTDAEITQINQQAAYAQEQYDAHIKEVEASRERMAAAQTAYNERKRAKDIDGANRAIANFAKAKQGLNEHMREAKAKKDESDRLHMQAIKMAETKARTQIKNQRAAAAQAMAQAQVAAEQHETEQREESNAVELEADEFIEKNYPDASEEEKHTIRERYKAAVSKRSQTQEQEQPKAAQPAEGESQTVSKPKASEANRRFAAQVSRKFGVTVQFGDLGEAEGAYSRKKDTIYLDAGATQGEVIKRVLVHELTHRTEQSDMYSELERALLSMRYSGNEAQQRADIASTLKRYRAQLGESFTEEDAKKELVADICAELLSGNEEMINRLIGEEPGVARRILNAIKEFISKLRGVNNPELKKLKKIEKLLENGLQEETKKRREAKADIVSADGDVLAGKIGDDTYVQYSLASWTDAEQETVRRNLINAGFDDTAVDNWIADVNSVAREVAADRDRLDFTAADNHVMLKPNQEYVKTLDASTLCAKRLIYQGTFNAIQRLMPNTVITSDGLIKLRNMMAEMGYETPCGICYVESRRRNLGTFAKKWLDGYDANGGYRPTLADVTTTDGLERMRKEHPEVYKSFTDEMKRKGSNNPKVVQLRTDYRGDIRSLSASDIKKIIDIGGLRVQSFSDFETPHLLDMMQAVLDMTEKGLTSQAYTKVPNFAAVFGDTGIKINLSLIAEGNGLDENGNLIFSSYEGMDFDRAMELRDMYGENVGTILVGLSDDHIRAAMADPRIDFIIPFHKSGWGKRQLSQLSGMSGYMDYTRDQNERMVVGRTKTGKPKTKNVKENFHPVGPNGYWDFDKTGNENAEIYLRKCEEDGRIPKFSRFLTKDADGKWVAPDGYWKLLIDFKMYDNDGVGAPQRAVTPAFNMDEAMRVLAEYDGDADNLPVAQDVVERFVGEKGMNLPNDAQFALPSGDLLDQEIEAWLNKRDSTIDATMQKAEIKNPEADSEPNGERQFATKTMPAREDVPDRVKQLFLNMEDQRYYDRDTNQAQMERSWNRLKREGYQGMHNRLMNTVHLITADDIADANMLMALAIDAGDTQSFLDMATYYNIEGTRSGQELQARKLFKRMTPTGMRVFVAGQLEKTLKDYMEGHKPHMREVQRKAGEKRAEIEELSNQEPDVITRENSRYGIPLSEQHLALIKAYGLENEKRPGDFYNRATLRQRMLEAILQTPDPLAKTDGGLDLVERLEVMSSGKVGVITTADLKYIGDNMELFVSETDERQAALAISRVYEAYGNITPASMREKARTWRYTSMLASLPSAGRNVIGNTGQNLLNASAKEIEIALDAAIGRFFTGERTAAQLSAGDLARGFNAFRQETVNTFRDFFIDRAITHEGDDRFNLNQRGRVYQTQAFENLRLIEGFLMSVGDRNFWKMAFVNSMSEQMKIAQLNGTEFDAEAAIEQAERDANYATFNEDSRVRDLLSEMKQIPIIGDMLDFVMPFTGTPTNIVKRMYQFSPAGLAVSAINHTWRGIRGQNFNQKDFVQSMSRGLTGTAMYAIGMALYAAGVIKLGTGEEEDQRVYGVETAQGKQYSPYIQIGDLYVSLSTFSPAVSAMIMGATSAEIFANDEDKWNAVYNAATASIDSFFDASYMSALNDIFGGQGSFGENLINTMASNAISQNVPAVISHIASSMDEYVRDTKDKNFIMQTLKSGLISKIPGLREKLPEKVDVAGRSVENTKQGIVAFIDPLTTTEAVDDPALNELMRLNEALNGQSDFMPLDALSGKKNELSGVAGAVEGKDKESYKKRYGELWRLGGDTYDKNGNAVKIEGVDALIKSDAYKRMSDTEKTEAIKGVVAAAKDGAVYETGEKLGHVVKEEKESGYAKKGYRAMPARFTGRDDEWLKQLGTLYRKTGDGAFIPKAINNRFEHGEKVYDLNAEQTDELWELYELNLEIALTKIDWDADETEVAEAVESAYTSAATKARNTYIKRHPE